MNEVRDSTKKKRNRAWTNYIRYMIVVIFWCILLFMAIRIDKAYQNKSGGLAADIVDYFVQTGHKWGVSYNFLYDALGGHSSILLTVIGMIVTGWVNLSDRLEKTVYGIRRRELLSNKWWARCIVDSFIGVFITPAWMVYAIIRRYCFTAYFILAIIFVEFLISNVLVATTYNKNQDYVRLHKKLLYFLKNASGTKGFDRFDGLLDKIEMSIDAGTDWKELETLFLDIMYRIQKEEALKAYRTCYAFVSKIYAQRNREQLIKLATSYMQQIGQENRKDDSAEWEKERQVYWILLDCLYQNCTEEQIDRYLDNLFDSLLLNRVPYKGICPKFTISEMEDIFAMVTLHTEYWLQRNNSELDRFGQKFGGIFIRGLAVYITEKRHQMLLQMIYNRKAVTEQSQTDIYQCYRRLTQSCLPENERSHIRSLIESIAELQDTKEEDTGHGLRSMQSIYVY